MSSIVVAGDTSGSITIAAPAVAGSGTLTLPTGTDTLVGKATTDTLTNKTLTSPVITGATITVAATAAPAFSAYANAAQTVSSNVFTKIVLQVEEFDTNSNFDNTTNYRFTPTVSGYYQINGTLRVTGTVTSTQIDLAIYKNGSVVANILDMSPSASLGSNSVITVGNSYLIYMNGSTDYIELYGYYYLGTATFSSTSAANTSKFQAFLARSA